MVRMTVRPEVDRKEVKWLQETQAEEAVRKVKQVQCGSIVSILSFERRGFCFLTLTRLGGSTSARACQGQKVKLLSKGKMETWSSVG